MILPATAFLPAPHPIDWVPWNWAATYWTAWFALAFPIGFVPMEFTAIGSGHPENSLSAFIWRVFHVVPHQPIQQWSAGHVLLGGAFALLAIWLIGHFVFGAWT